MQVWTGGSPGAGLLMFVGGPNSMTPGKTPAAHDPMNLFEALFLTLLLAIGLLISKIIASFFAVNVWFVGFLVIPIACFGLILVARRAAAMLFPACVNGKCGAQEYKWGGVHVAGQMFECKCGQKYVLAGRRFMLVDETGEVIPYMRRVFLKGWIVDETQSGGSAGNKQGNARSQFAERAALFCAVGAVVGFGVSVLQPILDWHREELKPIIRYLILGLLVCGPFIAGLWIFGFIVRRKQ